MKNQTPSSSTASPTAARQPDRGHRRFLLKTLGALLALGVLGITAYSLFVAIHEPDPQETILLGQTKIDSASPAAFRIVVRNRLSGRPIKGASVILSLSGKTAGALGLGTFHTGADGSVENTLNIPNLAPGEYQLIVDSSSSVGRDHIVKTIELRHPTRILLSSDKPIYQPGQAIHLRSLVLNERTGKPFASEPVTFEISDPKGNKVFKQACKTSAYGIASADFELASELILGRYEIRVIAGAVTAERTVEIKQYVLPKFMIGIRAEKSYYLPGQTVSGSIKADYFFGKAVGHADVKLTASTIEEKPVTIRELQGRTDARGAYPFQFVLPNFFTGIPQNNGMAFLDLTAEIRDTAGHSEKKSLSLSVAQNELEITPIPEAGQLVPGVENVLYILSAYPDGRPAQCQVTVDGKSYRGDAQGLCRVPVVPSSASQQFDIEVMDARGRKRDLTYVPDRRSAMPALLLRTDKALYQAGETARLSILSPEKKDTVFLDVVQDGQTVLTRSVPLVDHKAQYALGLPASAVGMLKLHAYVITASGEDRGCSRLIYIKPAFTLHISARLSQTVYRPGQAAKLDFTVTDARGRAVPAALGIDAVDESVFALGENRPGLLGQFFDAENQLLKPRYQIKFFNSPTDLLQTGHQGLAAAYLASLENIHTGPTLDELVRNGEIPRRVIEHARQVSGTPAYEFLRRDPNYAAVFRLLNGGGGIYNLREVTGPVKLQATEAHRKAYFNKLRTWIALCCCGLLFLLPVVLLAYYGRSKTGISALSASETPQNRKYVELTSSTYHLLAVLILCPLLFYPFGGYFVNRWNVENGGWKLLLLETAIVFISLGLQLVRIAKAERSDPTLGSLKLFPGAFLGQFIFSRLGLSAVALHPMQFPGALVLMWLFGSIAVPLAILAALRTHIRRQMSAKNLPLPQEQITLVGILTIISLLFVFAAMLLPALSKAKSRAQRASLLNDLKMIELAANMDSTESLAGQGAVPRIRRDFPETLFWQPELITDEKGRASVEIPLADSITTWRTAIDGISSSGKMGSVQLPIKVFQDFFADIDLPVSMTLGDEVSVPVTCYNYLKGPQDIHVKLRPADWFESSVQLLNIHLEPDEVRSVYFPVKVTQVGTHALQVVAQGSRIADALERQIQVVPSGQPIDHTRNDVLTDVLRDNFVLPSEAIPGSQKLWIKFYPSRFSEVVEGLDSIFQAPYGCFEQTSSTTYPNVLVLDYLKRMGRLTPEIEIKARKYINAGYQRLLTFEVPGGGFEWFGRPPANVCLTAYGVLEFTDMARVHPVDQAMMARTRNWLYSQQSADGSWRTSQKLEYWDGDPPVTAYVAWALAESGDKSPALIKALGYLRAHSETLINNYQKALAANAFLAHDPNDVFGRQLLNQLIGAAIKNQGTLHWASAGMGMSYSHGSGLDVETTALCAMALIQSGTRPESVKETLAWLSKAKTNNGTWGSTQATVLAMRALLLGSTTPPGQKFDSAVKVIVNGRPIESFHINKENSDVMKQVDLSRFLQAGDNRIELRQAPTGQLPVQVSGVYWLPGGSVTPALPSRQPDGLQIDVQYDRSTLAVNDLLQCSVTVTNRTAALVHMAIVDLGIPPGFEPDTSAFESLKEKGRIAKFEVTGNQIILYLRELSDSVPFNFNYSLRAKYPLRVEAPPSSVYEYYQPQNRAQSKPVALQVIGMH